MWGNIRLKAVMIGVFLIISMQISMVLAVTINPAEYTIKDPKKGEEYSVVITAINPDSGKYQLSAEIDKDSAYLKDFVKIEPSTLELAPDSKENIRLKMFISDQLSPQNHNLKIIFRANNIPVGKFILHFALEGEQITRFALKDFSVDAASNKEPIYFNMKIENTGNIIVSAIPKIEIFRKEKLIGSLGNETSITLFPGKTTNLSLMYDPGDLKEDGKYLARASLIHEGDTKTSLEQTFVLDIREDRADKTIEISQGELLEIEENIKNLEEGLSFYRITWNIGDMSSTLEGETDEKEKIVPIVINTSQLQPGTYDLDVIINHGLRLEKKTVKHYSIKISKKSRSLDILKNILIILVPLIIMVIAGTRYIPKIYSTKISRIDRLFMDVKDIKKSFDRIDHEVVSMRHDMTRFIRESNAWIRHNIGKDIGFR